MDRMMHVRRIRVLLVGCGLMMVVGLLYAWSIFRTPLSAAYPDWGATQVSITFTISMVFFCLGVFLAGKISAHLSGKAITLIAAASFLIGFGGLALLMDEGSPDRSLAVLYIFYGVFCGNGVGMTYNSMMNAATKWFPSRAGTVSGILLLCYGFGGLVLAGIVQRLIGSFGLTGCFLVLAVGIAVVMAAGAFSVKRPTEEEAAALAQTGVGAGLQGGADAAGSKEDTTRSTDARRRDYSPLEMLKTPVFWLFCVWNIALCVCGLLVINSAAVIAVAFGSPAVLGLIVSVFNGLGRLLVGSIFDRKGRDFAMNVDTLVMLCAGLVLLAGALTVSPILIFIGLSLAGIGYGGGPPSTSALVNNYFGARHYAVNLGVIQFSVIPGAVIGPLVSSALQESSDGRYDSTFAMYIACAAFALVLVILLRRAAVKGGFE